MMSTLLKERSMEKSCLLPVLLPFNWINPRSVVVMDNASIHHVDAVAAIIERQYGGKNMLLTTLFPRPYICQLKVYLVK